ncbi:MAG TPA: glycosyltransferase family 39 protein [Candidatus Brocadiia bacterium]|nr:glycosyltransferase family 39 protein [Candidatus Brocadiales bacterium]
MTPSTLKEQKYHTLVLSKSNVTILLCLIIFIAAFLRLYYLSTSSFSSDDMMSIEFIERNDSIIKQTTNYGQPPFYFFILHYWTLLAGTSEFALRLPTAIFGILSVFVLFKLASLIFDNKTALIGALLLAVNPEHLFPSFALKQYTLTALLALVSVYLLLRALKECHTTLWIAFSISNIALLCTHYSAIIVVLTELSYIAIVYRKYKYTLQIFSATAVICLMVAALFFLQKEYVQAAPEYFQRIAKPTLETFLNVLSSFIAGFYIKIPERGIIFADAICFKSQGSYIDALPMPAKISIFAFFSIFLLLGIFKCFWRQTTSDEPRVTSDGCKPLIFIWATIPILSAYAISFLLWPIFGPTKYHLFWSCSILLLIARGFAATGKLRFIYPILFIAVCIHLFPILTKESNPRMLNWKGVADYLRENVSDGETVHFLSGNYGSLPLRYYYKEDVYIGVNKVFEKMTSSVNGGRSDGVFLIEAGESALPVGWDRTLDMFYTNKDVKQFYHIDVTHYWNGR